MHKHFFGVFGASGTKNVRVAVYQLFIDALDHISDIELAAFTRQLGMHHYLHEQVAQFRTEQFPIGLVQRLQHLVALFEEVFTQRRVGLFFVPRASLRPSQAGYDFNEAGKLFQVLRNFQHIVSLCIVRLYILGVGRAMKFSVRKQVPRLLTHQHAAVTLY